MSAFQLKLFALTLMFADHIHYLFLFHDPLPPAWLTWLGRLSAPIFVFLMVESFCHTQNRDAYRDRLLWGAVVMISGSVLLHWLYPRSDGLLLTNNIFLTLGWGVLLLEKLSVYLQRQRTLDSFYFAVLLFVGCLFTEGGLLLLPLALVFYTFRTKPKWLIACYLFFCLIMLPGSWPFFSTDPHNNVQWMMIFALPFFFLYNGKRGLDCRWLFYLFYPLHLWFLYLVSAYLQK